MLYVVWEAQETCKDVGAALTASRVTRMYMSSAYCTAAHILEVPHARLHHLVSNILGGHFHLRAACRT